MNPNFCKGHVANELIVAKLRMHGKWKWHQAWAGSLSLAEMVLGVKEFCLLQLKDAQTQPLQIKLLLLVGGSPIIPTRARSTTEMVESI